MSAARLNDAVVRVRLRQDEVRARLDRIQGHGPSIAAQREVASIGREFQRLLADLEIPLPRPRADESPTSYKVAILAKLQGHAPDWKTADLVGLAAGIGLSPRIEAEIVGAAQKVADDPSIGSFKVPGALRRIEHSDSDGVRVIEWRGDPAAWMRPLDTPVYTTVRAFGDGKGNWFPEK